MKKILLATLILSLALVEGVCASPKEDVKKGNLLYNDKKYDEAVRAYNEALSKRPDSGIANLNLGAALYKKGSYDRAIDSFNRTIASGGGRFVSIADYNIGNAQYKLGNLKEASDVKRAKELYEMALKFYKRSMELDPRDKDTKFNYEFVENRLKNLSQTQKKEEEKKDKNEEKKEDNKKDKSQDQDKSAGGGGGGQGEEKKKEEEKKKTGKSG